MNIYDFSATLLDGTTQTLSAYRGNVLLIVNVASRCGFTNQYAGLEALYQRHKQAGLVVLGFPCNQFGDQEPGDAAQIQEFCSLNYGVSFPMFAKIDVNGPETHPIFTYLKAQRRGLFGSQTIKWNFTKFLVDQEGAVVARFAPTDTPELFEGAIIAQLRARPKAVDAMPLV